MLGEIGALIMFLSHAESSLTWRRVLKFKLHGCGVNCVTEQLFDQLTTILHFFKKKSADKKVWEMGCGKGI